MAKRQIINTPIPSIDTAWDNGTEAYSGEAVEKFIKEQFKSKVGSLFFDDSEDSFLTVYTFRSEEDKTTWLLDRSDESLVLGKQTFNVASRHGEGTAYVVTLTAKGVSEPKFTNTKRLIIPIRFTCKKATTVAGSTTTEDMAGISGTIVVTGRKAGVSGNFSTITPSDGETRYIDAVPEDSETYKDFDLGPYLQDGEWNYRITVIEPEKQTSSSAVSVNVTMSESMGLEYAGELGHPFEGDTVSLPFYVKGSVDRLLHLEVLNSDGSEVLATPEPRAFSANQGGSETVQNIGITKEQYKFTHGTYRIHAWLTFASDINGTKVSEQTFGIMYKEDGNNTILVAVSDAITNADNYDSVTLLKYAVYNPSGESTELNLSVVDGMDGDVVYYQETAICENETTYSMNTVLNCEHELGDFDVQVLIKGGNVQYYSGKVTLTNNIDFSVRGTANLELIPNSKTFHGTDKRGNSFVFDPDTLRLVDQPSDNKTNIMNPTVEGYIREDNIDRLRLLRGSVIDLPFEPIITTTGLRVSGVDYSLTMEFDIQINRIVDESAPVIACYSDNGESFVGLKVLPERILVLGTGQGPISTPDMADYYLEEGCRMHIAVNIVNNLRNEGLNYMRIFVDGIMQREYTYQNTQTSPFCGASGSNGHLVLGSTGCDLDIFGMRIMLDQSLSSSDIQQDYKASMSNITDKRAFVAANDEIMSGSVIDYDKAKAIYNTILYRLPSNAKYPTFNNDPGSINNVVMEVNIIGDEKHSGIFSSVEIKRQGSTAKKYYWPNISSKLCKEDASKGIVKGTFTSTGIDPETSLPYYNKTNYYQLDDSQPKSKKWVGKSNYASSMQSHKIGATAAFHDLHRICALPTGGFSYDQTHPDTPSRRAVLEKPFLCFFTDAEHSTPTFCGFQTWGAAKGDKPTFGYDDDEESDSYTPDYIMVEGADNNVTGANFETPWIPSEMLYVPDEESFCYNGAPNFDLDLGLLNEDAEDDDPLKDHPTGGAVNSINNYLIPGFNMVYLCNPNLRPFAGGLNALNQAYLRDKARQADPNNTEELELESNVHYWNSDTSSGEYLNVYRMDYINDVWVDAGLFTSSSKDERGFNVITTAVLNLLTQLSITDSDLLGMSAEQKNDFLIEKRVVLFKSQFPTWFDVSDALFHQCFIKLVAGTDNRAKNTYYWIEGNIDHKIRFDGDDMDTIFKTDNKGQQSKKYWILEDDKDEYGAWFWNGRNNALFRLIEMAYEDDMRTMMNRIFAAMATLSGSVENFFQNYFYYVQEYFPAVAYNEAGRLLYETAQLYYDGIHPSEPGVSYGYKEMPITQSLGNQLHAERAYMVKRLALIESYANYGDFSLNGTDSITFTSTGSSTYNIKWTAYQDIFPVAAFGQALDYGTDENGVKHTKPWRLKAGHTYTISTQMSGETTVAIHGMSFCSSIDNLGANAIKGNLRITGKRLRNLVMPKLSANFVPSSIVMASNLNLEVIDWKNIDFSNSNPAFDFTSMMSLVKLDLSGCSGITGVEVPHTASLTSLFLPSGMTRLELNDMPSLKEFSIDDVSTLNNVLINNAKAPGVDTLAIAGLLRNNAKNLYSLSMLNVNWNALPVSTLMWIASIAPYSYGVTSEKYSLTGKATLDQSAMRLTYDNKRTLVDKYGNIDSTSNILALTYDKIQISQISIVGKSYISKTGTEQFSVAVTPVTANNVAITVDDDGNAHEDVKFCFVDESGDEMTPFQYCNWQDAVKGLLNVTNVTTEAAGTRYTLRAIVKVISGGTTKELTADMQVAFYLRHPKVGDFAYADGTFDDQYQKDKTLVGMVFKLDPMYQGKDDASPITYSGFNKPSESVKQEKSLVGYRVLIDCKENAVIKSKNGVINTSSNAWGLYPENAEGNDGMTSTNGFTTEFGTKMAEIANMSSVFDTSMANIVGNSEWQYNTYIYPENVLDYNNEDGFKEFSNASAPGDFNGASKTRAIVRHMEQIFNNFLQSADNEDVLTSYTETDPETQEQTLRSITNLPTTLEELGDMMEILQKANGDLTIFRQFAYPAAYSCYLYEPKVKEGESLDAQYAKGKWFLPSQGELMRQFMFFAKSRTGGWTNDYTEGQNTSPSTTVIDDIIREAYNSPDSNQIKNNVSLEHIETGEYTSAELTAINQYFQSLVECDRPIYSLILWRAMAAGASAPFTNHTLGNHWSSTEGSSGSSWGVGFSSGRAWSNVKYGSTAVRPSVAYSFML